LPSHINGIVIKNAVINASNNLANNKKIVDDMNVFPVPDGDTGTNMSMTLSAAAREVLPITDESASAIAEHVAYASLRGARGNSGVILSQLLRGFSKGIKGEEKIDSTLLAKAMKSASDTAYKAVMKPTEGTMLTVAREAAKYAIKAAKDYPDVIDFAVAVTEKAKQVLDKTPEMLPVLKQAGVVDAGGKGLIIIMEGFIAALKGEEITPLQQQEATAQKRTEQIDTDKIKYMYCTEFIITKKSLNYSTQPFRAAIETIGDSMLVIEDGDIVKVHIHTNRPGFVIEHAVKIGELSDIKIDNMKYQHSEKVACEPPKKYGIIAVAAGEGLENIFKDIGVDRIVKGGQSMNPSTEDILSSVESLNAENIIILPNNKNIILAAEQAAKISKKNVNVIPSRTIPQGISAVLMFEEEKSLKENKEAMTKALSGIKTGQVTFAARHSVIDGKEIAEGDILGMEEGDITVIGKQPNDVALQIINKLADEKSVVITLFFGADISEAAADELSEQIKLLYPNCDVMAHSGGQPLYYYIISVE
jgi:DAK2 domain fusion protein YloV